jgi:hypothetical protein
MCDKEEIISKIVLNGEVRTEFKTGKTRVEKTSPDAYRLGKKSNGEYVLLGAFFWSEGKNYGHEWKGLETVEL